MATLHILSNPGATASCTAAISEGDALVLIGNGVFALPGLESTVATVGILQDDAAERGISAGAVQPLAQADFVDWVVRHERSVTWR